MSRTLLTVTRQLCPVAEARSNFITRSTTCIGRKSNSQMRSSSSTTAKSNPFAMGGKHGDFKKIEATRPEFNKSLSLEVSKTPDPTWKYGKGPNDTSGRDLKHVEIDPYHPEQQMMSNYKLLISGIPRPISFVSTVSKDGQKNLAPFSYFQVVDHDPPILVIGFSVRASGPKDTRVNLSETGECVVSVVSEHMIEAVNGTSMDTPYGTSEWELSGFQSAPSSTVQPDRVKDAIFSMEGKLLEMKDLDYGLHAPGKPSGSLAIIKVTRFWIREDALNDKQDNVKLSTLKPLVQLGGISYGRVRETFELPRPGLQAELEDNSRGLRQFVESRGLD